MSDRNAGYQVETYWEDDDGTFWDETLTDSYGTVMVEDKPVADDVIRNVMTHLQEICALRQQAQLAEADGREADARKYERDAAYIVLYGEGSE